MTLELIKDARTEYKAKLDEALSGQNVTFLEDTVLDGAIEVDQRMKVEGCLLLPRGFILTRQHWGGDLSSSSSMHHASCSAKCSQPSWATG